MFLSPNTSITPFTVLESKKAVLEPKHMKPSYMKFLDRMTAHRLHLLNR
ncbi:unnamed protein product, partial [Oppiella nova]